ncbi:unnamed protein product [Agarophyton chilense]
MVSRRKSGATKRKVRVLLQVPENIAKLLNDSDGTTKIQFESIDPPILTVGDKRLIGRYEDVIGTDMVFDPSKSENAGYIGACTKRLICTEKK